MTTWVRLKRANDWGQDYYAIEPLDHGSADSKRGVMPPKGTLVRVKMPDDTERLAVCAYVQRHARIPDMGRSYDATFNVLRFLLDVSGVDVQLKPDQVDVPADWVAAYTRAAK